MTDDEISVAAWLSYGGLCQSCGLCCVDVADAPITLKDIGRLMRGLHLAFPDVIKLGVENRGAGGFRFDMARGYCKALSVRREPSGRVTYPCGIYEHRPDVCRKYQCAVLRDLRARIDHWGEPVPRANMFHDVC